MSLTTESKPSGTAFDAPLDEMLGLAGDAFIVLDELGRIVFINRAAEHTFGYTAEEVLGGPVDPLLPERFRNAHAGHLLAFCGPDEPVRFVDQRLCGLHKDGREFPVEVCVARMECAHGTGIVLVMRDVTDRVIAERRSEQLGRIIEASVNEIYLIDTATWSLLQVNRCARRNLGYDGEALQRLTLSDIAPALLRTEFEAVVTPLLQGCQQEVSLRTFHQRRDGSTYEVEMRLHLMPEEQPPVLVAIAHDVTAHAAYEALIQRYSHYDPLTLLPNRTLLTQRLERAVADMRRDGTSGALLLVNVSDLRLIDDTLGRDTTDRLLQEVAARLEGHLRGSDTLARVGGREFAIIAPSLDRPGAATALATRILDTLAIPFTLGTYRTVVSAHVGVTLFPDDGTDAKTLLRNADTALWNAVRDRTSSHRVFTPELTATAKTRLALKSGLTGALERNEFQLAFQPQMNVAHGHVRGVEALLRWTNPDLGEVPPADFVPVLEDTGLIAPVGDWVLEEACRQRRVLKDSGFEDVRMAVNLSVRQIRPAFLATVGEKLERYGLAPGDLEFEITETVLMREGGQAVELLEQMAALGFHLAMDDFGCGYSSLSHLRRLPLGTIKIDRSFISELTSSQADAEIVRAIVGMGKALNRRLIAEGVETDGQLAALRDLGCDEIQGFLISPPLHADELMGFLHTRSTAPILAESTPP